MKNVILFTNLLFLAISSYGQQTDGDILMKKSFWGTKFIQDERILKPREVLVVMESNDEAYQLFKKAKANYDAAGVIGFVGGFMVGWPIGTAIGGGDPAWGLAAAGGGVLLLAIPLSSAFNKHATKAVAIYNGSGTAKANNIHINVLPFGAGAKLVIRI